MAAFLEDLTRFYGTGEKNEQGQTLEQFLDEYDVRKYVTPSCTTDTVIFSYDDQLDVSMKGIKILLVQRSNHPSIGYWALPGGFADMKENLIDTAKREVEEETGVKGLRLEQIAAYGNYDRDPRTRVITTAYMALVQEKDVVVSAGDDAKDACWCNISFKQTDYKCENEVIKNVYELTVNNESRNLATTAVVEETLTKGLIKEQEFTVIDSGVIACDHAAIIVHALKLLKTRLEKV